MDTVATAAELHARLANAGRVAFVPTMGNLHEGHLRLMRIAREHGDSVVASVFVNPLQFGPNEDFDRYPRTFDPIAQGCGAKGLMCSLPRRTKRYTRHRRYIGSRRRRSPRNWRALHDPGFFHGVCTVVLKLFNLVRPDVAVFGKKDRQQLKIVRGMVQQFNLPIRIVPAETVRADDGLALATRNSYLSAEERLEAPRLYRTLSWVADEILGGRHDYANLEAAARATLSRHGWKVDYIAIRHGLALRIPHPEGYDHPNLLIVLGAAMLGTTRLIDNVDVVQGASED